MKIAIRFFLVAVVAVSLGSAVSLAAPPQANNGGQAAAANQPPAQPPLTEKEVIHLIKKNKKNLQSIAPEIVQRGVAFEMSPEIQEKLEKAGADANFIANVKNQTPSARAAMSASMAGKPHIPAEEFQEFQNIRNELDPDRKIQMVNAFATKYPNSSMLTFVYFLAQGAALQKGDVDAVVDYGRKALNLKPDNLNALMLMADILPQPQAMRNAMDPDKQLDEAEADARKAIDLINAQQKQPSESDAEFQARKLNYLETMHSSLGLIHFQRAVTSLAGVDKDELAKADNEYSQAVTITKDPDAQDFFRLGEVYAHENKVPEAIDAFTQCSKLSAANPSLQNLQALAQQKIQELKSKKK
jgi:tetratricopeptide (TPR) repeat protein